MKVYIPFQDSYTESEICSEEPSEIVCIMYSLYLNTLCFHHKCTFNTTIKEILKLETGVFFFTQNLVLVNGAETEMKSSYGLAYHHLNMGKS